MNYSATQLDMIVKLVVERLRQSPEAMPASGNGHPHLATIHEVHGGQVDTTTLTLSEKVITTATLENRLTGIQRVLVSSAAVVTPSARDFLRDSKIHLQVGGRPIPSTGCRLVIGSDQGSIDPSAVAGQLAATCLPSSSSWQSLLQAVTRQISDSRKLGVLITDQAAAVLCVANRNPAVRAMGATTVERIMSDKRQIGANLLVMDPLGRGTHGLRQMIDAFAREGYLDPPRGMEV